MQWKEICWNITTKCNQNCRYCHRFLNIDELPYEKNEKILNNLIQNGITDITWTGGEALLYPNLIELLKIAKENQVKNKLITNGMVFAQNDKMKEICNYLDSLTLSIDSTDNETNTELGRGENHYDNIKTVLDYVRGKKIKLNINTVVSKKNINDINELGNFLNNYEIDSWRVFKFMPLRETAEKNRRQFEITDEEFETSKNIFKNFKNISDIEYREEEDMENRYILLVANGDIIKTENGKDVKKGNALYQNLMQFMD